MSLFLKKMKSIKGDLETLQYRTRDVIQYIKLHGTQPYILNWNVYISSFDFYINQLWNFSLAQYLVVIELKHNFTFFIENYINFGSEVSVNTVNIPYWQIHLTQNDRIYSVIMSPFGHLVAIYCDLYLIIMPVWHTVAFKRARCGVQDPEPHILLFHLQQSSKFFFNICL